MTTEPFSVYVHVPFCARKCPYCDFNTYAVARPPEDEYITAVLKELDSYREDEHFIKRTVKSVFFGGGTPSLLSPTSISVIIDRISDLFGIVSNAEITLEANPNDADTQKIEGFKSAGINRISFGVQSFDNNKLVQLGRDHLAEDAVRAVEKSIDQGLDNISVDIIFGVPDQTVADLESDLKVALSLPIKHISTYSLTIEPGTPFYQRQERGLLKLPPDSRVAQMLDLIPQVLEDSGFKRYEISNYSKPGYESVHNLVYWSGGDYLGVGAGAHSYHGKYISALSTATRWSNLALPAHYIEKIRNYESVVAWREKLEQRDLIFEFFYLGMRRVSGVRRSDFFKRFGVVIP
jgi:oxygen-independent coproporphyrinogen-3 oxidase